MEKFSPHDIKQICKKEIKIFYDEEFSNLLEVIFYDEELYSTEYKKKFSIYYILYDSIIFNFLRRSIQNEKYYCQQ